VAYVGAHDPIGGTDLIGELADITDDREWASEYMRRLKFRQDQSIDRWHARLIANHLGQQTQGSAYATVGKQSA
jgi:hypothetical protein